MTEIYEKRTQPITRDIRVGIRCDRCQRTDIEVSYEMISPIKFSFDPSEEAEIAIDGDICYDCLEAVGDDLRRIAEEIRRIFVPHGSVRSSTMMQWEPTGFYADE